MYEFSYNETSPIAPIEEEVFGSMDMMREFGAIAFASRLKRLGDRLKSEATMLYRANGVDFNDSWFLVALVLSNLQTVSVTGMAEALGVSHAAISQMVTAMKRKGLVAVQPDERDKRRTLVRLTDKGHAAVEAMQPVWNVVGECAEELITSTNMDLLTAISVIEEQLEQRSLIMRATERMHRGKVK